MKNISINGENFIVSKFIEKLLKYYYQVELFFTLSKFNVFNKIAINTFKRNKLEYKKSFKKFKILALITSVGNHKIIEGNFTKKNSNINFQYQAIDFNSLVINKKEILEKSKYIPFKDLNTNKSLRLKKAFTWPGVIEPAYKLINNKIKLIYIKVLN